MTKYITTNIQYNILKIILLELKEIKNFSIYLNDEVLKIIKYNKIEPRPFKITSSISNEPILKINCNNSILILIRKTNTKKYDFFVNFFDINGNNIDNGVNIRKLPIML